MTQRAYRGRRPCAPMEAASVVEVVDTLERAGIDVWLDGGWGVDALLERELREHDDLDLICELRHTEAVIEFLARLGYELVAGGPPNSFVCVDLRGRQVDVHPVTFDAEGGGLYQMEDGRVWVYPAQGFGGRGRVAGRSVRCLNPETQVIVHAGYALGEKDYRELYLLRERFGVQVPDELLPRVLAAGP
jgi:lincosamide nucleotidyltransferase A/C/D/E